MWSTRDPHMIVTTTLNDCLQPATTTHSDKEEER